MKHIIRRSLTLAGPVSLVLLLSLSAFAFPSVHTNEITVTSYTYWGGGSPTVCLASKATYYASLSDPTVETLAAGATYYSASSSDPTVDRQGDGGQAPPAVPEPTTVALLAAGLFGMRILMRRRRNKIA
jgi:hypothetical protein